MHSYHSRYLTSSLISTLKKIVQVDHFATKSGSKIIPKHFDQLERQSYQMSKFQTLGIKYVSQM